MFPRNSQHKFNENYIHYRMMQRWVHTVRKNDILSSFNYILSAINKLEEGVEKNLVKNVQHRTRKHLLLL